MGYTSAASTIIAGNDIAADYVLELKPQGAGTWTEFKYVRGSLSMTWEEDQAATLSAELINADLDFSDETYPDSYTALGVKVRVTSRVRTSPSTIETRVEFLGEIVAPAPVDQRFMVKAYCDYFLLTKALCQVRDEPAPKETAIVSGSTRREVQQIDPQYGEAYGFISTGPGDIAFDAATGTIRRPWSDRGLRVWSHATDTYYSDDQGRHTYELSNEKFRVDYRSGALTIIEDDPQTSYYISGVGAFEETQLGASASNVNADYARLWEAVLLYAADKGGVGCHLGTEWGNAITAVNTGAKRFTIAGDYRDWYKAGGQIYVQSSTGNNGTFSIASVSLSGGNTLIVVTEAVPSGVADGYLSLDCGIDMPGIMPFDRGKLADFADAFSKDFQRNVRLVYDDDHGKYWLKTVIQKAEGSTDWTLYHAKSIDQTRDGGDTYTGVLLTGRKTRPVNLVEAQGKAGTLTDLSTGGTWFGFNDANRMPDGSFSDLKQYLYDGLANMGIMLHNINDTPDVEGTAGDKLSGWYYMFGGPLDPGQPVRRIEAVAPATRNENAQGGDQGKWWPGLRLQISDDDITYFDMTPLLFGVYEPGSTINIEMKDIPRRYGRYWRLLGRPYQWGESPTFFDSGVKDFCVGCAELRLYQDTDYEIMASISPMHPIVARTTGAGGTLSFTGDFRDEFHDGDTFTVRNNANGATNGSYTVATGGVAYNSATDRTTLTVTGTIPVGTTVSGELYSTTDYRLPDGTTVKRDYPDLWDRFGGRLRVFSKDMGERYNESLAKMDAILMLQDQLALYQQVSYETSVPDPRVRQYDTVNVADEMNGNIGTLLVRSITKTDTGTTVRGINYRSGPLGT